MKLSIFVVWAKVSVINLWRLETPIEKKGNICARRNIYSWKSGFVTSKVVQSQNVLSGSFYDIEPETNKKGDNVLF